MSTDGHGHASVSMEPKSKLHTEPRLQIGILSDYDLNNNGSIEPQEAVGLAKALGMNSKLPVDVLKKASLLIDTIDTNRDSKISEDEFKEGRDTLIKVTWLSA